MVKKLPVSEEYVLGELKKYKIPGMGLSISVNGESLIHRGYGYANVAEKRPINTTSAFGIASCTKAFTSALIAILVDKGLIEYDKPIVEYLPDFKMDDETASKNCTIRDMLMHRTGLSEHDAILYEDIDREEVYRRLQYLKSRAPFRSEMIYNNTIFTIIGAIAEKITGLSWDEMIIEWLFKPLGMTHSKTRFTDIPSYSDYASPYWNFDGNVKEIPNWYVGPGQPAGGIVSTLDDAIKWLEFNCRGGVTEDGVQLISPKQMNEMHTMQIETPLWSWSWNGLEPDGAYGLGWFGCKYKGYDVVWTPGEFEGYCTLFAFVKEANIAYASFVNLHKPCVLPLFSVLFTALDEILDLPKTDWSGKFGEHIYDYGELHQYWDLNLLEEMKQVKGSCPSHELEDFEGTYWNIGYGEMRIVLVDGELRADYRGVLEELVHFHFDTYALKQIKEDTLLMTLPLTFKNDPETNEVIGLSAQLDPAGEPIEFIKKGGK